MAGPIVSGRSDELELGGLRARAVEYQTQIDRAEQDVALGHSWWLRRRLADRLARRRRGTVTSGPLVSVITAAYRTEPAHLSACLESVARQTYRHWEHVVVDDGSGDRDLLDRLRTAAARELRVRVLVHDRNRGISAAGNSGLEAATGDVVVLLDHDDVLAPDALERMVAALAEHPEATVAYSDHDVIRPDGRFVEPFYKPDFSPERLRNQNYVLHLVAARRQAVRAVGGFRLGFDGAQDHDLLLRLSEAGPVVHVPEVLYHWRQSAASVSTDSAAKPYAYHAGVRAVQEHCDRVGIEATVEPGRADGLYRIRRSVPDHTVSVIIPTRGTAATVWGAERVHVIEAIRSLVDRSGHRRLEFVVVADADTPDTVAQELRSIGGDRLRIVAYSSSFNFSDKCNVGAAASSGEALLFLNDDTELIDADSVGEMLALVAQRDVGMVGARLLFADGTMQHAGHVYPGLATHALVGFAGGGAGPNRMAWVERECAGVTAAAAMLRRDVFEQVGGFDVAFPSNFNDVDVSCRLRRSGYRIVWTPHASWYHFESASRDPSTGDAERDLVIERWQHDLEHDPYFNPNLAPHRGDWLERPGRSGAPPYYLDDAGRRRFS